MPGTVQSAENVATSKADTGACPRGAQALEKRDDQRATYRSKLDGQLKKEIKSNGGKMKPDRGQETREGLKLEIGRPREDSLRRQHLSRTCRTWAHK